jgi:hypothetical protein
MLGHRKGMVMLMFPMSLEQILVRVTRINNLLILLALDLLQEPKLSILYFPRAYWLARFPLFPLHFHSTRRYQ